MNREIKFRCWIKPYYKFDKCKKDYRMIYPHLEKNNWYVIDCQSQTLMEGEGGIISDYKMYLQQFTGLHDKNGKEIYEGDILNGSQYNNGIYIVKDLRDLYSENNDSEYSNFNFVENCEVIGNIFENPELINN